MVDQALFSTAKNGGTDIWGTPDHVFKAAELLFGRCDLDVCASAENTKCKKFYSEQDDGLSKNWSKDAKRNCWMNPPYSEIDIWMKKAIQESRKGASVICLVPARTDTDWWHRYTMKADDVIFLRGRIKFGCGKNSAPFPSALIYFRGEV